MTEILASLIEGHGVALAVVAALVVCALCGVVALLVARNARLRAASHEERELARFRQLADATFSGVFVHRENIIMDVNAALCRFMGCDASDMVGHKVTEFVAPHCVDRLIQRIQSGQFENEEFDVLVKSGEQRTVEVITRVVDYRGGQARVIALRDVSERKHDELLRAEEHRILTGVAENQPLKETLTQVCRLAEAALPGSICSVLLVSADGRSMLTIAGPNLPLEYNASIDGALIGPSAGSCGTAAYRREVVIVEDIATDPLWADYKHLALKFDLRSCWSVPLIAKSGKVLGTFATYRNERYRPAQYDFDVINRLASYAGIAIQRTQLHDDLIAARDHAEAASRAKSQFLANMSHELRTPLNAILGFSEIISRQTLGQDAQARYIEYARDIHDSGTYLLSLINDVLDVARVEAGKVRINREHCGVAAVVEEQLKVLRCAYPDAAAIGIDVGADCPDLLVDHRAFGQILMNVIGNAAKFTPREGAITLFCHWQGPGLRLHVKDSGPGIPASMLEEIGKPFRQVENAYSRRHPGTGLGLYISRSLMRLHGGDLEIASRLGQGTTVTLVFPEDCVLRQVQTKPAPRAGIAAVGE